MSPRAHVSVELNTLVSCAGLLLAEAKDRFAKTPGAAGRGEREDLMNATSFAVQALLHAIEAAGMDRLDVATLLGGVVARFIAYTDGSDFSSEMLAEAFNGQCAFTLEQIARTRP